MQNHINGKELLLFVQSIASERGISQEEVLGIFAEALAQSLKKNSQDVAEADFRVVIDPQTGQTETFRRWHVLSPEAEITNPQQEIYTAEAQEKSGEANINPGDIIEEPLDIEYNQRIRMLSAKQYLNTRLRDAERQRWLNELLARNEDLVSGQVLRVLRDKGDAIIEVMKVDCRLPKREQLPRESIKVGDRIQAMIKETVSDMRGRHVILSRCSTDFLKSLFHRIVPEIEKGVLEIVAAARDPGVRAKIAVRSTDPRVDPVGTCVGIKGSRVQAVTDELKGERIDIIHWDPDDVQYVLRALSPAEVTKVSVDEERRSMEVLVEPDLMAQAIGKGGINVRLATELTGWQLNLMTPEEYHTYAEEVATNKSKILAETLDLDMEAARILYDEGFESLDYVAYAEPSDLMEIEGFDASVVEKLQERARMATEKKENEIRERMSRLDQTLRMVPKMTDQILEDLVSENILTLDDLADLSISELLETIEIPASVAKQLVQDSRRMRDIRDAATEAEAAAEAGNSDLPAAKDQAAHP